MQENPTMRYHLTPVRQLFPKEQKMISTGKNIVRQNVYTLLGKGK